LKLNGTLQLLAYADDINMVGEIVRTVKENAEGLVVASKEIGLKVNVVKSKYMVMYRDQTAGRSDIVKAENIFLERVAEFKYLGTTLTNQNSIQKEVKTD
jgi:hypothetical protein